MKRAYSKWIQKLLLHSTLVRVSDVKVMHVVMCKMRTIQSSCKGRPNQHSRIKGFNGTQRWPEAAKAIPQL